MQFHRIELSVCLLLIVATVAVFSPLAGHEFVGFDDDLYVTQNPHVRAGLNLKSVVWAFTTFHAANWHPLTWLSHMADYQWFGLRPGMHHLTSLLFHVINSVLLFLVLKRITGGLRPSAFVAFLFALHPLHVESAAWIAERKDVLSTFFWMLTVWAYAFYAERPGPARYLLVLTLFALGLLAKPMLVTLPCVLLLLDYWPLGRYAHAPAHPHTHSPAHLYSPAPSIRLVLEKTPLFLLTALSGVMTLLAQRKWDAVASLKQLPLSDRIANALVCYVSYAVKMVWPYPLSVFYPHRGTLPLWQAAGACLLLGCVSLALVGARRRRPFLAVGWLWFLVTLLPVIGLVQVGTHSMADRYTYVPLIGLFILIAWGVPDLMQRWRCRRVVLGVSASMVVCGCMVLSWRQVGHWKNAITLFEHAVAVTTDNDLAHYNLGVTLEGRGRLEEAAAHYAEVLRIRPDHADAHTNMGVVLTHWDKLAEAAAHFSKALLLMPDDSQGHVNLALVLQRMGKPQEAASHYVEALRIKPDHTEAHCSLGVILSRQGNVAQAVRHYGAALRSEPDNLDAHVDLGVLLARDGKLEEAKAHFSEALRIDPGDREARHNFDLALRLIRESAGTTNAVRTGP